MPYLPSFMTPARRFSFFSNPGTTFAGVALLGLVLSLAGCQSTEQASVTAPAQAPAPLGAPSYPDPNGVATSPGQQALQIPVQPGQPAPSPSAPLATSGAVPAAPGQPSLTAKAAILVDGFGRVLYEKNADVRRPTASTQKLLLGILVAESGNFDKPITVVESDTWAEPTVLGLKPGEVYPKHQLLTAVLVRSCNDIARVLARDHSGSDAAFAAAMNQRARQLGMMDSYFTNSNGLPSPPGQYSTARDLAKLGMASLRNPYVREAVRTKTYTFRLANGSTTTLNNTNQVLKYFPYCTGLKTGFTNAAGRCLVSSATANGKTVIAVVLGCSSTKTVSMESESLLRYGLDL
jgi:D-alanyl-D-alanine carboxypeptidase (penicillin-binding protein 5/6)